MKLVAGAMVLALTAGGAAAADLTLERVYSAPDLSGPRARGRPLPGRDPGDLPPRPGG